jgi:hypothetical protein
VSRYPVVNLQPVMWTATRPAGIMCVTGRDGQGQPQDVLSNWFRRMLALGGVAESDIGRSSQLTCSHTPTPSVSTTNLTQALPSCLSPLTRCRRRRRIAPFSTDVLNPTQPIQNVQPQCNSSILASSWPFEVFCFDRPCSRS